MSWPSSHLVDLCKVITKGTTPTTLGFDFANRGVAFLRIQNIAAGRVNYERDTLFINEQTHHALQRSQILPGDVLVSIAGTIGRSAVVPKNAPPLNCNQAVAIVRTNGSLFQPFLRHWLESSDAQAQMHGAKVTGTISNLSLTQVGNLRMPVPPVAEQQRIAAILDRADDLKAKRRVALVQLENLTHAIFVNVFCRDENIPNISVEECMEAIIDYRGKSPTKTTSGIPLVTARVVKRGELLEPNEFIAEKDYERWMRHGLPKAGDVLFTTEAPLGEVAQLDGRKVALAQRLLVLRGKPKLLDNTFLKYALTARIVRRQIDTRATGSTVRGIRQSELRKVMIPIPPLGVQHKFARHIAAVDNLKAAQRASLAQLNALFASLQHRAFRGEI